MNPIIFATYAESDDQLRQILAMVESLREFGGRHRFALLRTYLSEDYKDPNERTIKQLLSLGADIRTCHVPKLEIELYFVGKVYAAGKAEADAEGQTATLVWLDTDTLFLDEPADLLLGEKLHFACRPIMHNRSGSLHGQPPDPFWGRIYERLSLTDDQLFPMMTPADHQKIRAYFNAGLLAVKPETGILRKWGDDFTTLHTDEVLADMCAKNETHRIFLHQTALVGAVLNTIKRDQMVELNHRYNYPLFFKEMFGGLEDFESIQDIVTIRYENYFRDPKPDWHERLNGPGEKITWIRDHLCEK